MFENHNHNSLDDVDPNDVNDDDSTYAPDKDDLNDDDDNNEDSRNDVGEPNNDPGGPIEPVEPACELDDGEAANEPNEEGVACY